MITVAGEHESERRSRRANALEPLLVWLAVLFLLWPVAYGVGVMGAEAIVQPVVALLCGALCLFMFFVSPRLHGDTASDWGVGSPASLVAYWRSLAAWERLRLVACLAPVVILMLWMNWRHWPEVAAFVHLDFPAVLTLRETILGSCAVFAFGALLCGVFLGCAVRYDNFGSAFRTAMALALPLCLLLILAAALHRGRAAFEETDLDKLLLHGFGYIFWGFLQQLLFSGYFCTRLRRAFPPGPRPAWTRATRALITGTGGVVIAVCISAIIVLLMRQRSPAGWTLLPSMVLVILPMVCAFLWALLRDPHRVLVAALSASFFASIHIPSYGLVIATFVLGLPLAYVFMNARNRNLVALSFVHAVLGATLYWLFSNAGSGEFFIDYHVGPWNVKEPDWSVLWPPVALIGAYAVLAGLLAQRAKA